MDKRHKSELSFSPPEKHSSGSGATTSSHQNQEDVERIHSTVQDGKSPLCRRPGVDSRDSSLDASISPRQASRLDHSGGATRQPDVDETQQQELSFEPLPAQMLDRDYSIQGVIGQGRFGSVWRCVDKRTGEAFALKAIDKRPCQWPTVLFFDPAFVLVELECLARAQGHPNVLQLENVFESEGSLLILTELCAGGDLYDHILARKFLAESEARALFCQLAEAVQHCHARGVVHRDIKPENVLLQQCSATGRKTVRLADFGLATVLQSGQLTVGQVGSKPYEAPEVADSRPYDAKADVFSLGVLLFSMLSGRWPHFGEGKVFCADVSFHGYLWQGVSREALDLMTRMMAPDPGDRPSAEEILRDPWLSPHTLDAEFRPSPRGSVASSSEALSSPSGASTASTSSSNTPLSSPGSVASIGGRSQSSAVATVGAAHEGANAGFFVSKKPMDLEQGDHGSDELELLVDVGVSVPRQAQVLFSKLCKALRIRA